MGWKEMVFVSNTSIAGSLSKRMAKFSFLHGFLILVFGVLTPTLDQYTDLTLVIRLLSGPNNSTVLKTGRHLQMESRE